MLSDRGQKHRDKFVAKMSSDNESQDSYEIFKSYLLLAQIITGDSKFINRNRVK